MQKLLFTLSIFTALLLTNCNEPTPKTEKTPETMAEKAETPEDIDYDKYGISEASIKNLNQIPVGESAPDFSGKDQNGNQIQLSEMTAEGDVVIVFYRGFWCGYCTKYLAEFTDKLDDFKSKGAQVIAIAPEGEKNIAQTVEKTGLEIPFISDGSGEIMRQYGVEFKVTEAMDKKFFDYKGFSLAEANEREEGVLPIPATYIIGKGGKVKWAHFDPNYSKRASIDDIFANL